MERDELQISDDELDSADEYIKRKKSKAFNQVRRHRNKGRKEGQGEKMRALLVEEKALNPERVAGIEWRVWHQRALGKSVYKIANEMGVTLSQVYVWLQDAMAQIRSKTTELIELDKEIELQRTEELMERYMPIALMDDVIIERIRQGEPVAERDLTVPQHCAYVVMELIKLRAKLKGFTMTQIEQALLPTVDVMGWLHTQKEFIAKTVKDAPRDVLTLEVEESIDETPENIGVPEGIQGAI